MLSSQKLNHSLFVGVDAHKYEHTAVVANRFEEELGVFEFANNLSEIENFTEKIEALSQQTGLTPIFGIEGSGGNGMLLAKRLIRNYTHVYEVNPIYTKSRRTHSTKWDKSDRIDAKLVIGVLTREVNSLPRLSLKHTHSQYYLALDFVVAANEELTKEQTRVKNHLHLLFHQEDPNYRQRFKTVFSKQALNYWKNRSYQKSDQFLIQARHQSIIWKINRLLKIKKQLKVLEGAMKKLVALSGQKLETLPGVNLKNAARLLAYVRDIKRFSSADKFSRYIGCVPEKHSSAGKSKNKKAKMRNQKLYSTIYSIALTQLWACQKARTYYEKKLLEGKSKKQARRCLMKRIGIIIYGMMKHKGEYKG
jgi:transposase